MAAAEVVVDHAVESASSMAVAPDGNRRNANMKPKREVMEVVLTLMETS